MSRHEGEESQSHTEFLHEAQNADAQRFFGKEYKKLSKPEILRLRTLVEQETTSQVQAELNSRHQAQSSENDRETIDDFLGTKPHAKANEKPWNKKLDGLNRKRGEGSPLYRRQGSKNNPQE